MNFSNACIYKIVCKDTNVKASYIGSTVNFKSRMCQHKNNSNNLKQKYNVYQYIRANGGWNNWEMIKIKDVKPCLDRYNLRKVEGEYQKKLKPILNKRIECRTQAEYKEDNKEKILNYHKEYNLINRELLNTKSHKYRCDNIDKVREKDRIRAKKSREVNKEYMIEYEKKNKERLKAYRKEYWKKRRAKKKQNII